MAKIEDLRNLNFGRLKVLNRPPGKVNGRISWFCKCECGTTKEIIAHCLKSGNTQSCGCFSLEARKSKNTPIKNIKGQVFNYLTAIEPTSKRYGARNSVIWICSCVCGKILEVPYTFLYKGSRVSCGCVSYNTRTKHGAACSSKKEGVRLDYSIWCGMKVRCYNKKCEAYPNYGGRGIKVCKEWKKNFVEYAKYIRTLPKCPSEKILSSRIGGKRLDLSLDRINNDGNYEPGNLRWATRTEQNNNTRKQDKESAQ